MIVDKCDKTCFMARPTEQVVGGALVMVLLPFTILKVVLVCISFLLSELKRPSKEANKAPTR